MRKWASAIAGAAAVLVTAGCGDEPLAVQNVNNPDVDRAYSTPTGIEQVIGTTYQLSHIGMHGSNTAVKPQLFNMAFESYASVANNGMALRAALPRLGILNGRGNQTAVENFREFSHLQRAARTSANAVGALDRLLRNSGTLGSPTQNARARSFGFFGNGMAIGMAALIYDSVAAPTPALAFPSDTIPPLLGARAAMAEAIALLDSAIAIATAAPSDFTLPTEWMRGNALSRADYIRVVRSYRAILRANVARTPAERNAVDWAAVIADAENGITADFTIDLAPAANWANAWIPQHHIFQGWHQMPMFIIGMADTSRAYDAWLATPLGQRAPFLLRTPDQRFPQGATRAAQIANSPAAPTGIRYFRNRATGQDTPGESWGTSFYDHYRFIPIFNNGNRGPWPAITRAEIDMLAAEGHIRAGRFGAAATLIDRTRVAAGLPSLVEANITSATQPVPGGNACVPRVPVGPAFTSTQCGNIFEAMKYEKRLETAFTGYAVWYFDARGWGDLAEGTALEYPVPYQEMDSRSKPSYNLGGVNGPSSAAKGTYGF